MQLNRGGTKGQQEDCSQRGGDEPANEVQEIPVEQSCRHVGLVLETSSGTQAVTSFSSEAELYAAIRAAACATNGSNSLTEISCHQSQQGVNRIVIRVRTERKRSRHADA